VITDALEWLLHPDLEPLLDQGAPVFIAVVAMMIFAESGLLFGFFLPGDSLLFSAGLVVALAGHPPILLLMLVVTMAAIAGDQVGYIFGARVGPSLFTREDSRFFKQANVAKAHDFFEKHGPKALILARFVPVVRTFTPILAGVSRMQYRTFVTYNVIGGVLWGTGATLLGYALGKRYPWIEDYLTPVVLLIVAISVLPIAFEIWRSRKGEGVIEEIFDDDEEVTEDSTLGCGTA
jgi:membrane-associated protein